MLKVNNVKKSYGRDSFFTKEKHQVLNGITFECGDGECFGIIGESGSGKSTLGRLILGIERPDSGSVYFQQENSNKRKVRSGKISAVFQNYTSSINPFFNVEKAILEPLKQLKNSSSKNKEKVEQLLHQVGLDASYKKKYPHELSGGETQRVCIARAISTQPRCILLDEAISSLDIPVQFQILELLKDLKKVHNISYIFITHDIEAAAFICDRVIIFREGQIEEMVNVANLNDVKSRYAQTLLQTSVSF